MSFYTRLTTQGYDLISIFNKIQEHTPVIRTHTRTHIRSKQNKHIKQNKNGTNTSP